MRAPGIKCLIYGRWAIGGEVVATDKRGSMQLSVTATRRAQACRRQCTQAGVKGSKTCIGVSGSTPGLVACCLRRHTEGDTR